MYHKARTNDIEKWVNLVKKENDTMMKSRYAAWDLQLDMKVNNVEYQGDGSKAIFYYSADKRVDFRELIKILAENSVFVSKCDKLEYVKKRHVWEVSEVAVENFVALLG